MALNGDISENTLSLEEIKASELSEISEIELQECWRLYENNRKRAKRLRRKIEVWSRYGYVYFITLTFKDSVFADTNADTRRQIVRRYLSTRGFVYCANIDFGGQFGREHYHAIICAQEPLQGTQDAHKGNVLYNCPDFTEWNEKRGFTCIQGPILVKDSKDENSLKIAKYTAKASNHALKETTRHTRLVYSRGGIPWRQKELPKWDGFFTVTEDDLMDLPFDAD